MINGVGDKRLGLVDTTRVGVDRSAPVQAAPSADGPRVQAPVSAAAELAAKGAPVDAAKVAAIKAAIAEGRYPLDPARIADAMLAFEKGTE